jgi:hypothetical protein
LRHSDDLEAARDAVVDRRNRTKPNQRKTVVVAIREAFDAMAGESGEVSFKDLLEAVSKDLGRPVETLKPHFSRDIRKAGLEPSQPAVGTPSTVRRPST